MSAPRPAAGPARLALLRALPLIAALAWPGVPRASTEEFSTFDVERPEEDDESLLDHLLTEAPRAWDAEWRRAPMAVRTAQGCLTSGQWLNRTQLRVHAPMGERARFGVELDVSETDLAAWNHADFTFKFPQGFGTPGAMFRPFYDKSRQDFAITYEAGGDTTRFEVAAAFTFEDMFNNLWAWRQTRVGNSSASYERHPFEPALRGVVRGERWRFSAGGKWLTPSRKTTPGPAGAAYQLRSTLWGALGEARFEAEALGLSWEASALDQQAQGAEAAFLDPAGGPYSPADSLSVPPIVAESFRRLWRTGLSARRASGGWSAELLWIYQSRTQTWGRRRSFEALDRTVGFEVTRRLSPALDLRAGGLLDRVGVARAGFTPSGTHVSREEKRLYFGLDARFGNVRVFAIEGLELDDEPYDVWLIHDKGFLGLQATF